MVKKDTHVHKIGGAGLGTTARVESIKGTIIPLFAPETKNIIILSAVEKVTRLLISLFEAKLALNRVLMKRRLDEFYEIHRHIISGLPSGKSKTMSFFEYTFRQLEDCISSDGRYSQGEMYASVLQFGELASSQIVSLYLGNNGVPNTWFDARQYIKTHGKNSDASIHEYESEKLIAKGLPRLFAGHSDILIGAGFIGRDLESDENTVLPLNGSDISASFFASSTWASSLTYYKDILGVWKEDNKSHDIESLITPEAYLTRFKGAASYPIEPISIEIANKKCIPVRICSFENPSQHGTWIKN